jgi:hypothetical protein
VSPGSAMTVLPLMVMFMARRFQQSTIGYQLIADG